MTQSITESQANHHDFVNETYSPRASDYLTSAAHATGEDLDHIEAAVRGHSTARTLDIGCGGGHVCYRVAPHVAEVVAVDLSAQMLETVMGAAAQRGFRNVTTRQAPAESLPFAHEPLPNERFDFVFSRLSAHHWHNFEGGLREARRVLAPSGRAIFIDSVTPAAALLDSHLQTIELLRDPTHVRNYTTAGWAAALARAGFEVTSLQTRRLRLDFSTWIQRTRTPAPLAASIRTLQTNAPQEVKDHFAFEADGSFRLDIAMFEARGA